jgi:integrase/recombinase XerD
MENKKSLSLDNLYEGSLGFDYAISEGEVDKIFRQPDLKTRIGFRDRLILEILYYTRINLIELYSLDIWDVNPETRSLLIRKDGGRKEIDLKPGTWLFMEKYVKEVRDQFINNRKGLDALFLSIRKKRMSKAQLQGIIAHYAKMVGISRKVTFRMFRYSSVEHGQLQRV